MTKKLSPLVFGLLSLCVSIAIVLSFKVAFGQEHEHGQDGLPDWYDPICCNVRDCKPVLDKDVQFGIDVNGTAIITYLPTGNVFYQNQWKQSQDERMHACIFNNASLCFYIRAGA